MHIHSVARQCAARQYLELLKSGSQDGPLVLIQKAGVDLTKPETLRSAFETFEKSWRNSTRRSRNFEAPLFDDIRQKQP